VIRQQKLLQEFKAECADVKGYFGTLGPDTFRGPGFHQFDIALIKNTSNARRAPRAPAGNGPLILE